MNKSILLSILTLILISSCGSFEDEKKSLLAGGEKKDLVNSFDITKEQASIYQVSDHTEPKKEEAAPTVAIKKMKTKGKDGNKVKSKIDQVANISLEKVDGSGYPSEQPELFKNYDIVSKPIWEKFKPLFYKNEQSIIAISYLGVTAGYITMTAKDIVNVGGKPAFHYFARFKSKDAYRYFYWLDDTIETFIDKGSFLPIKYSLIQREKKQNVDDLQLFDFKKLKTMTWYKRVKEGSNKDEHLEKPIPRYLQDSFSALQFVRGLPLKKGELYDFPVSTRGETWLLKSEVIGEEMITVNDREVRAIRLTAETHFPGVLQKSGDINFCYAADESKRLLKFQAKVKIGSILGELVEFKPGVLVK